MHKNNPDWKTQPNYAVLVDTRDRPAPQITYVPQVGYIKRWREISVVTCIYRKMWKLLSTPRYCILQRKTTLKILMVHSTCQGPGLGPSIKETRVFLRLLKNCDLAILLSVWYKGINLFL